MEDEEMQSCEHEVLEPHTCPFREDVNGDYTTLCTCCEKCQHECAMDI